MYILFNLEPSKNHVGGSWYSDQTLDIGLINGISQYIIKLLNEETNGLNIQKITELVNASHCATINIFFIIK